MADDKQTEFPFSNDNETHQNDGPEAQQVPAEQPGVSGVPLPNTDEQNNEVPDEDEQLPELTLWSVYDTADGRRYEQTAEQITQELLKRGVTDAFHGEGDYISADASVIQVRRADRTEPSDGPHSKAPIEDEQQDADAPVVDSEETVPDATGDSTDKPEDSSTDSLISPTDKSAL